MAQKLCPEYEGEIAPGVHTIKWCAPLSHLEFRKLYANELTPERKKVLAAKVAEQGDAQESKRLSEALAAVEALEGVPEADWRSCDVPRTHCRTTVLKLGEKSTLVYAPFPVDSEAAFALVSSFGSPAAAVFPSRAYHSGVSSFKARFPNAVVIAPHGFKEAHGDLSSFVDAQIPDTTDLSAEPGEGATRLLLSSVLTANGIDPFYVGPVLNEIALLHKPTKSLLVADLVATCECEGAASDAIHAPEDSQWLQALHRHQWLETSPNGLLPLHRFEDIGHAGTEARRCIAACLDDLMKQDFERLVTVHTPIVVGKEAAHRLLEAHWSWLKDEHLEISPRAPKTPGAV